MKRSDLFTAFNLARKAARAGEIDAGRLNRGLGIAIRKGAETHIERYGTTLTDCRCPDRRYRRVACKGMLALMLKRAAA